MAFCRVAIGLFADEFGIGVVPGLFSFFFPADKSAES
jgi:hypothetical protein